MIPFFPAVYWGDCWPERSVACRSELSADDLVVGQHIELDIWVRASYEAWLRQTFVRPGGVLQGRQDAAF